MSRNDDSSLEATAFRRLLSTLIKGRGDTPDWPLILVQLLQREFHRQRRVCYAGASLLVDRDDKDHTRAVSPEKSKTRMLFKQCRELSAGCLRIGNDEYWLISYEVPSFGAKTHQCADLLGLSLTGGLVVFECKLKNSYAPITSAVEGLDYLSCLTAEPNFSRLQEEFKVWRAKPTQVVPEGFEEVRPSSAGPHEVIVLATAEYYDHYRIDSEKRRNTQRGSGWTEFAVACESCQSSPQIRFAETDFLATSAQWVS